jgi:replication factor A1
MAVETGESLQLGEEVTARGEVVDGRLQADDVF